MEIKVRKLPPSYRSMTSSRMGHRVQSGCGVRRRWERSRARSGRVEQMIRGNKVRGGK